MNFKREASLALKMLRGQQGRAWLFMFCVATGVAARVSVGSFMASLEAALNRDARLLLAADVEVAGKLPLTAAEKAQVQSLLPAGSRTQEKVSLLTMASQPRAKRSRLVMLSAVEGAYPFYGTLRAEDGDGRPLKSAMADLQSGAGVIVQPELLVQLGLKVGNLLRLGQRDYKILGVLREEPGLGGGAFSLGPRVLMGMPQLKAAGLTGFGSRVTNEYLVSTPNPEQAEPLAADLRKAWGLTATEGLRQGGAPQLVKRVRSFRDAQGEIKNFFERFADFLSLVALMALLLGGVGVASVTRAWVREAYPSLGVLRALGASSGQLLRVYFFQCLALGALGSLIGLAGGLFTEWAVLAALKASLPVALDFVVQPKTLAWGLGLGLLTASLFSLHPLLSIRQTKPAQLFRDEEGAGGMDAWAWALLVAGGIVFALVAALEARSWTRGPGFLGAVLLGAGLLSLAATVALPWLSRRQSLLGLRLPFAMRHGLANLDRPGLRSASSVIALGSASLLLGTLAVHQHSLLRELDPGRSGKEIPQLFFTDVQRDQTDAFRATVGNWEGKALNVKLSPIVRARYRGKNGEGASANSDWSRESQDSQVMRSREQNLSWRPELTKGETLIAGKWMDPQGEQLEASLEQWFAKRLGVGLGDRLLFDVQGVEVEATVTSLRKVHWASFQPNFFILLSPWALQDAPQTWIGSVGGLGDEERPRLQYQLVEKFPNLTLFDVAEGTQKVMGILQKVADAVRLVALFCLATGLVVLLGLTLSNARARMSEGALLKVLGAGRGSLLLSSVAEFGTVTALACLLGLGLSVVFGWVLMEKVLEIPFSLPWQALGLRFVGIVSVGIATALLASARVFRVKPLEVLREDA